VDRLLYAWHVITHRHFELTKPFAQIHMCYRRFGGELEDAEVTIVTAGEHHPHVVTGLNAVDWADLTASQSRTDIYDWLAKHGHECEHR